VVLAGAWAGCASTPPAPAPEQAPKEQLIRSTWDRCDPAAVELMERMFRLVPGDDAMAVWRTAGHPTEGVAATEGEVEMILQEDMGSLPAGTELGGRGIIGELPAGSGQERRVWRKAGEPEEQEKRRFFVRITALRLHEEGMVWPACMMVMMDGVWGAPLTRHESGALVMKEVARVKVVSVFDESKPLPK
jgi:hypothetical protein